MTNHHHNRNGSNKNNPSNADILKKLDEMDKRQISDIKEIKDELKNLRDKGESHDILIKDLQEEIKSMKEEMKKLSSKADETSKHNMKLEAHGRRLNVIWNGIKEEKDETPRITQQLVKHVLINKFKFDAEEVSAMMMRDCHRLPLPENKRATEGSVRPIISAFIVQSDRNKVMENANCLKGSDISVKSDLPKQLDIRRNMLLKKRKDLAAENQKVRVVERSYLPVLQILRNNKWVNFDVKE